MIYPFSVPLRHDGEVFCQLGPGHDNTLQCRHFFRSFPHIARLKETSKETTCFQGKKCSFIKLIFHCRRVNGFQLIIECNCVFVWLVHWIKLNQTWPFNFNQQTQNRSFSHAQHLLHVSEMVAQTDCVQILNLVFILYFQVPPEIARRRISFSEPEKMNFVGRKMTTLSIK